MKVRRKYSLNRIGLQYESLDIEVEHETIQECLHDIQRCWQQFMFMRGKGEIE